MSGYESSFQIANEVLSYVASISVKIGKMSARALGKWNLFFHFI